MLGAKKKTANGAKLVSGLYDRNFFLTTESLLFPENNNTPFSVFNKPNLA